MLVLFLGLCYDINYIITNDLKAAHPLVFSEKLYINPPPPISLHYKISKLMQTVCLNISSIVPFCAKQLTSAAVGLSYK